MLDSLANAEKQVKNIKGIQIQKKSKTLFTYDMIAHIENSRELTK